MKIGTTIIAIVLLIIFGGLLFGMYSVRLIVLPESISQLLGLGQAHTDDETSDLVDELDGAVRGQAPNEVVEVVFEVDLETLLQAFLDEPRPEGVYIEAEFAYHETNSGILSTQSPQSQSESEAERQQKETFSAAFEPVIGASARFVRDGNRFRAEIFESGKTKLLMIGDGTTVFFRDNVTGESRSLPQSGDFSPENEIGFPSVDALFDVIYSFETDIFSDNNTSDSTELESQDVKNEQNSESSVNSDASESSSDNDNLETYNDRFNKLRYANLELLLLKSVYGNVYYVAFDDLILSTREEYYVSLEGRTILRQRITRDDVVIYDFSAAKYSLDEADFGSENLYTID